MLGGLMRKLRPGPAVPEKCPACRDTSGLITAGLGAWFHCDCCGKDFTGGQDEAGDWHFDLRSARERARQMLESRP